MTDPFRGYVRTANKRPCQKFGSGERLLSLAEAEQCYEYAGILNGEFTSKDIDNADEAERLFRLIVDRDLNCRVMKTTRGMQFFFRSSPLVSKNLTHVIDALGFEFDIRTGRNSYCVLKKDGKTRELLRDFDEERDVDTCPPWLAPLSGGVHFAGMGNGEGRNGALFAHTGRLLRSGFSKEQVKDICEMINGYVFAEPLPEDEITKILRNETFDNYKGASATDDFGAALRPQDFSDKGMVETFVNHKAGVLRYCNAYGWLSWDGIVWKVSDLKAQQCEMDFTDELLKDAKTTLRKAYDALIIAESGGSEDAREAAKAELKDAQAYHKFTMKMREHSKITGVLKLARSALEIDITELDGDAHLLNTPGGIIDLNTGRIMEHRAEALCTKVAGASPGIDGQKMWQECLEGVTGGDTELQGFLQYLAGAMAIGQVYHEALVIAHGDGANGKSTFFNTIAAVLGDYAGKIPAEALTTKAKSVKVDLAELVGKRFVLASETEEGQRLSVSMLKQIASIDSITAERKYHDPFVFKPTHTTVLYTNHLPKVGSGDHGTWRRLVVAPFTQKIDKPETDYAERLFSLAGGAVMSWIVKGAKLYIDGGHKLPACRAIDEAVSEYKETNDWFGAFVDSRCEIDDGAQVAGGLLYTTYREWALSQGEFVRSTTDFSTALLAAGFEKKRLKTGRFWCGLSLRSEFLSGEELPF